jgi:hypothetical protein
MRRFDELLSRPLDFGENFDPGHCPSKQVETSVRMNAVSRTTEIPKDEKVDPEATAVDDLSQPQRLSSSTADIKLGNHLLEFLRNGCAEAMKRSKYKFDAGPIQDNHWTTGNDAAIAYQARIDSGSFGVVFQVI